MKVVHCKKDKYDVYIGRPSKWGNPFKVGVHGTQEECVNLFKKWIHMPQQKHLRIDAKNELKEKILGCWCYPKKCHGEVLIDMANKKDKPMFKVSYSKVDTFRMCKKKFYYSYVEKLERKFKARPLKLGSLIHDMLDIHSRGGSKKQIWDVYRKAKKEHGKLFKEERELYGDLPGDLKRIMKGYFEYWADDTFKIVKSEELIEVPLTDDILLIMYYDQIIKDKHGHHWPKENKSKKTIPTGDFLYMDTQTNIYFWALGEKEKKLPIKGLLWDYIRTKAPVVPELTKKGVLSKANIDTTWDVYRQAILDNGLKLTEYRDMRKKLKLNDENFLKRLPVPRQDKVMQTLVHEFTDTAIEMRDYKGCYPRTIGSHCDFMCDFKRLCTADLRGVDRSHIVKNEYKPKEFDRAKQKQKKTQKKSKKKE